MKDSCQQIQWFIYKGVNTEYQLEILSLTELETQLGPPLVVVRKTLKMPQSQTLLPNTYCSKGTPSWLHPNNLIPWTMIIFCCFFPSTLNFSFVRQVSRLSYTNSMPTKSAWTANIAHIMLLLSIFVYPTSVGEVILQVQMNIFILWAGRSWSMFERVHFLPALINYRNDQSVNNGFNCDRILNLKYRSCSRCLE